jgi:hypothetical protein
MVPRYFWNRYLRTRLVALSHEIGAEAILFDGVAPYRGLLSTRQHLPEVAFLWMRRGMWIEGKGEAFLRKSAWFDAIIEPGDLGASADQGPTVGRSDAVSIPPVSMLEVVPRLSRREAAAALGLDPDRPTMLVTLGTGRLGDASAPGRVALETLLTESHWQVAVTTAAIAMSGIPIPDPSRVVEIRGVYPLVRYLEAFDAVVSASGYNAVHEFVSAGLPTLLVPNRATRTDDQIARARGVADRGLARMAAEDDLVGVVAGVRSLLDQSVRNDLTAAIAEVPAIERMGGAGAGWGEVATAAAGHSPTRADRVLARWSAVDDAVRSRAMSAIGQNGTDLVRKLVRRPSPGGIGEPRAVSLSGGPGADSAAHLLFSEEIGIDDVRSGRPIEHLLVGASERYRQERMAIIRRNYRLVDDAGVG